MGDLEEIEALCKKGYRIIEVDKNVYFVLGGKSGIVILKKKVMRKRFK